MLHRILLLSDGTGETAQRVLDAALVQFSRLPVLVERAPQLEEPDQLDRALEQAKRGEELVVYTLVRPDLRARMAIRSLELGVAAVDLLGPLLDALARHLQGPVRGEAGLLGGSEAGRWGSLLSYAVAHDDGQRIWDVGGADLVLVGPSRTSKTALSGLLALKGLRVANVPVVARIEAPRELEGCDPRRVFALVMDCEVLARIRRERAHQPGFAGYADGQLVLEELELSRRLARQRGWCLVDTTGRALEEVADDVSASLAIRTRAAARSADRHPPRAA